MACIDTGWPDDLGVRTRRCRRCNLDHDESRYSMWLRDHPGEKIFGKQQGNPTCNECLVEISATSRVPLFMSAEAAWKDGAACGGTAPSIFFPETREKLQEAAWQALCDTCPVKAKCLEFGQQTRSTGVWGGQWIGPFEAETTQANTCGRKLLQDGVCVNGHPILSMDDIVIRASGRKADGITPRYSGKCAVCRGEQNRLARRRSNALKRELAKENPILTAVDKLLQRGVCSKNKHELHSRDDLYVTDNPNGRGGITARCAQCAKDAKNARRKKVQNV